MPCSNAASELNSLRLKFALPADISTIAHTLAPPGDAYRMTTKSASNKEYWNIPDLTTLPLASRSHGFGSFWLRINHQLPRPNVGVIETCVII